MNELLIIADPALMDERTRWLDTLSGERRLSPKTLDAYERDTRQFLTFLTGHVGGPAGLSDVEMLRPADLRSFLAARRKDGAGNRSLGRNLAGIRSFIRYLERKGLANAAGASAVRSPKQPKSLPKPLTDIQALRVVADVPTSGLWDFAACGSQNRLRAVWLARTPPTTEEPGRPWRRRSITVGGP